MKTKKKSKKKGVFSLEKVVITTGVVAVTSILMITFGSTTRDVGGKSVRGISTNGSELIENMGNTSNTSPIDSGSSTKPSDSSDGDGTSTSDSSSNGNNGGTSSTDSSNPGGSDTGGNGNNGNNGGTDTSTTAPEEKPNPGDLPIPEGFNHMKGDVLYAHGTARVDQESATLIVTIPLQNNLMRARFTDGNESKDYIGEYEYHMHEGHRYHTYTESNKREVNPSNHVQSYFTKIRTDNHCKDKHNCGGFISFKVTDPKTNEVVYLKYFKIKVSQ